MTDKGIEDYSYIRSFVHSFIYLFRQSSSQSFRQTGIYNSTVYDTFATNMGVSKNCISMQTCNHLRSFSLLLKRAVGQRTKFAQDTTKSYFESPLNSYIFISCHRKIAKRKQKTITSNSSYALRQESGQSSQLI